jgi:phage terminase large subunit GpA-like protein
MKPDGPAIRSWVAGVLRGIYSPEPDEEIWEWAERTLRIPATENEEMAGMLWSSAYTPYVREIMHWARRPGKGEFWIKKSSQVGFTMAVLIIICWMIVHRPGNVAYAIDSVHEARNISKTRLKKWIELNNILDAIGEDVDDMSNLTYFFRGMTVYLLGAFSKGGWANKSIVLFILDELDKHPYIEGEGTTVSLARERCKRPKNAKIIGFSTPGEGDQITTEHAKGTCEEIRIPFPCCGHYQALKWEAFTFGTKEFKDLADGYDREKVEHGAYFKCELCGGRLFDRQKSAAMQRYQAVPTNDAATGRIRSLHIWDAYSPFVTFGQLALEWLDAQGDVTLLERFMRGRRGEKYEKSGRILKHSDILACRGPYRRGTVPFVPILLCQTIDLQNDVQKAVKIAIDAKGNLHVIDWFVSLVLSECVSWAFEPVTGPDGNPLVVTDGFIDEGYRTMDVRRTCMENLPVFWPVKGRSGVQVREMIGTSFQWVDGEELLTYHIADDQFKWQLLNLISDREKRARRGETLIFFPEDVDADDDFIEEMCAERPVKKKNKMGREKWEWEKTGPNDFWDCVKYALALWAVKRPILVKEGLTR